MPAIYWPMLKTAENVATRYGISREAQDRYGVQSQLRAAAARAGGRFESEIVPHPNPDEARRQGDGGGVDFRSDRQQGRRHPT